MIYNLKLSWQLKAKQHLGEVQMVAQVLLIYSQFISK
jgi:hypothetical protein